MHLETQLCKLKIFIIFISYFIYHYNFFHSIFLTYLYWYTYIFSLAAIDCFILWTTVSQHIYPFPFQWTFYLFFFSFFTITKKYQSTSSYVSVVSVSFFYLEVAFLGSTACVSSYLLDIAKLFSKLWYHYLTAQAAIAKNHDWVAYKQ